MFEVLMFIFENYMDGSVSLKEANETIGDQLEQVGFDRYEIDRALDWLEGLDRFQKSVLSNTSLTSHAMRHYLIEESEQLGVEGIGLLLRLEQLGILDPPTREIVIDRVMALDLREINQGRIKWIVLMALFNQPEKKSVLLLLQDMILADALDVLH